MTKHESMAIAAIGALTKAGHLLPVEVTADDIRRGIEALTADRARLTRERDEALEVVGLQALLTHRATAEKAPDGG